MVCLATRTFARPCALKASHCGVCAGEGQELFCFSVRPFARTCIRTLLVKTLTSETPPPEIVIVNEAEERIDVVDEQDRFVEVLSRKEVHRRGVLHRSVHVFLVDEENRIYLQRRAWSKEQDPGLWDSSASGHVDSGESYDAAAERELEEELGVHVPLEPLFKAAACPETSGEHSMLYRGRIVGGRPAPQPNPAEILEGRFVPLRELRERVSSSPESFASPFRHIFARYCKECD
jgi:isopentenyl-diphosphate delta-isomerase type 1